MALLRQPWFIILVCLLAIYTYAVFDNAGEVSIRPSTAEAQSNSEGLRKPIQKVFAEVSLPSKEVKTIKVFGFESMNVTFANGENGKLGFRLKGRGRRYVDKGENFSDWLNIKQDGNSIKLVPSVKGDFTGGMIDFWANEDVLDLAVILPPKHGFEDVKIKSVSGDVTLNGLKTESLDISLVSGDVQLADGRAQELKIQTVSGDVDVERFLIDKASVKSVSGDVSMSTLVKSPNYKVKTVSGDLNLALPRQADLKVDFESMSGELLNQFTSNEASQGRVRFSSLSGDAEITKIK